MADYTLTADTLWSDISSIVDTDGDYVYTDRYTLTIDADVTPAIKFHVNPGGKIYCPNQSGSIRYINTQHYYYIYSDWRDAHREFDGKLISIGTVSGGSLTYAGFHDSMFYIGAVYVPSLGHWFFDDHYFTSYAQTNGILPVHEKPLFSYDQSTKTLNFNYKPLPDGAEIQFPNIVIHYNHFSDRSTSWEMRMFIETIEVGAFVFAARSRNGSYGQSPSRNYYAKDSILATGNTGYKPCNNERSINCARVENGWSNGALRLNYTENFVLDGDTIYALQTNGGVNSDIQYKNIKFFGDGRSQTFYCGAIDNLLVDGGTFYCGQLVPGTKQVFKNVNFSGWKDSAYSNSGYDFEIPLSNSSSRDIRFKNCVFNGHVGSLLNGSYPGGDLYMFGSCTLDISNTSYDGIYINYHSITRLRVFNMTGITGDPNKTINFRFSSGSTIDSSNMLVGYTGEQCKAYMESGTTVLDWKADPAGPSFDKRRLVTMPDTSVTGATHIYLNRSMHKVEASSSPIVEPGSKIYFHQTGEWAIISLYGIAKNFIDEVGEWVGSPQSYYYSGVDLQFSYDMENFYDWTTFTTLPVPQPMNLYIKATATTDSAYFEGIKLWFNRPSGWTQYPDVCRDQYINMKQLTLQDSLNCKFYSPRWNRYIEKGVSSSGEISFLHWYDDEFAWTYRIRCRAYGTSFEDVLVDAKADDSIDAFYTGSYKTDLMLTETEASAITGVVFQASADADYTWELDCGGGSLENAYHYVQYKLTNFGEWAGIDTFELDEFLVRDGSMFKTLQARSGEGVKLVNYSGKVSGMTKDDGTVYVPPVDVIMTIDNIVVDSTVYIHTTDDDTEILKTTASSSTVSATISGLNGKPYEVVIRKASSAPYYVEWTATGTIGTTDINLTANQQEM